MSELLNRKKSQVAGKQNVNFRKQSSESSIVNPPKSKLHLRVLSRVVVAIALLIVVYFSSKDEKEKPFAKQTEVIIGRGQIVDCSQIYINEIDKYEGCCPRQCKRYVTDEVVTKKDVDDLLGIAKKGFKFGGSDGGASILDLHSGALSKGQHFVNIFSIEAAKNEFNEYFKILESVELKIKNSLAQHFGTDPNKIYLTSPSFFSKITSNKAVTIHDEYWHPHVDKDTYKSFHFTTLLYLADYGIDFEGGRFIFIDERQNRTIEPRKGRVSMFTSGSENLHFVEKVKSGVRYALTIAFTCDKHSKI